MDAHVSRGDLLNSLRANRDAHAAAVEEAQAAYRARAIEELDATLADARAGRPIRHSLSLAVPVDHTAEYDNVIRLFEMDTRDVVVLEEQEFNEYVMNRWHWMRQFAATNVGYLSAGTMEAVGAAAYLD